MMNMMNAIQTQNWWFYGKVQEPEVKTGPQTSLICPEAYSGTMDATCDFTIVRSITVW